MAGRYYQGDPRNLLTVNQALLQGWYEDDGDLFETTTESSLTTVATTPFWLSVPNTDVGSPQVIPGQTYTVGITAAGGNGKIAAIIVNDADPTTALTTQESASGSGRRSVSVTVPSDAVAPRLILKGTSASATATTYTNASVVQGTVDIVAAPTLVDDRTQSVRTDMRLVMYTPNGPRGRVLGRANNIKVTFVLNEVGGLEFTYNKTHDNYTDLLAKWVEVAIELTHDGGMSWFEPKAGRFVKLTDNDDSVEIGGDVTFQCASWGALTQKMLMLHYDTLTAENKRMFNAAKTGTIIGTIMTEAKSDGMVTAMTTDFTAAKDSANVAWSKQINIGYDPGLDVYTMLDNLAQQAMVDWTTEGRTLRLFNADSTFARDLTNVVLRRGRDITTAPREGTVADWASKIAFYGDASKSLIVTDSGNVTPWGHFGKSVSQGGVSDTTTMGVLATGELTRSTNVRTQQSAELNLSTAEYLPFQNYQFGDYVYVQMTDGAALQKLRVQQITIVKADGVVTASLVLNDRFEDAQIRQAKKTNGILNGAANSGSGAAPVPAQPGNRQINPPTSLLVDSDFYTDTKTGVARAQFTLSWVAPDHATDSTVMAPDRYEVWARQTAGTGYVSGSPSKAVATVEGGNTGVYLSPYLPGTTWAFKIRAIGQDSTKWSAFTTETSKVAADDTVAPGLPTGIAATLAGNNYATFTWDGTLSGGVPADFKYIKVYWDVSSGFAISDTKLLGTLADAGYLTRYSGNVTKYFKVISVDRNGNSSAVATLTMLSDTTAPAVPTGVSGTRKGFQISAAWDGTFTGGGAAPDDFAGVEVHVSTTNGFTPSSSTLAGVLTKSGSIIVPGNATNVAYYLKFRSIDTNGNVSSTTSVTIAADTTAPPAPQNITATRTGKTVMLAWDGTLAGTTPDDFKSIEIRRGASGFAWVDGSTVATLYGPSTFLVGNNEANSTIYFKAVASDLLGNLSTQFAFQSVADSTAPPTPAGLSVSQALGVVTVLWDGTLSSTMPSDFASIAIHVGTSSGFTPSASTEVGRMTRRAILPITGLATGTQVWVKAIAYDTVDNASAAVTAGTTTPDATVSVSIADHSIAGIKLIDGAIGYDQIAAGSIYGDKLAANAITAGKIAVGALDGIVITGATFQSSASDYPRWEGDQFGIRLYDGAENLTVNFDTDTGEALITGKMRTNIPGQYPATIIDQYSVQYEPTPVVMAPRKKARKGAKPKPKTAPAPTVPVPRKDFQTYSRPGLYFEPSGRHVWDSPMGVWADDAGAGSRQRLNIDTGIYSNSTEGVFATPRAMITVETGSQTDGYPFGLFADYNCDVSTGSLTAGTGSYGGFAATSVYQSVSSDEDGSAANIQLYLMGAPHSDSNDQHIAGQLSMFYDYDNESGSAQFVTDSLNMTIGSGGAGGFTDTLTVRAYGGKAYIGSYISSHEFGASFQDNLMVIGLNVYQTGSPYSTYGLSIDSNSVIQTRGVNHLTLNSGGTREIYFQQAASNKGKVAAHGFEFYGNSSTNYALITASEGSTGVKLYSPAGGQLTIDGNNVYLDAAAQINLDAPLIIAPNGLNIQGRVGSTTYGRIIIADVNGIQMYDGNDVRTFQVHTSGNYSYGPISFRPVGSSVSALAIEAVSGTSVTLTSLSTVTSDLYCGTRRSFTWNTTANYNWGRMYYRVAGGTSNSAYIESNANDNIRIAGSNAFLLDSDGTYPITVRNIPGTTGTANIRYVGPTDGRFQYITSWSKDKLDQQPITADFGYGLLDLPVKTWIDKAMSEERKGWEHRVPGAVLEDVFAFARKNKDANVLFDRDQKGTRQGLNYDRLAWTLLPMLKDMTERIAKLEAQLAAN